MGKDNLRGLMEENTMANIKMTKNKDLEHFNGQITVNI